MYNTNKFWKEAFNNNNEHSITVRYWPKIESILKEMTHILKSEHRFEEFKINVIDVFPHRLQQEIAKTPQPTTPKEKAPLPDWFKLPDGETKMIGTMGPDGKMQFHKPAKASNKVMFLESIKKLQQCLEQIKRVIKDLNIDKLIKPFLAVYKTI